MPDGYSVRVLVKIFLNIFFVMSFESIIFVVIFMFKYDFTNIFHCTFYSGVLMMSDRKAIRSQASASAAGTSTDQANQAMT